MDANCCIHRLEFYQNGICCKQIEKKIGQSDNESSNNLIVNSDPILVLDRVLAHILSLHSTRIDWSFLLADTLKSCCTSRYPFRLPAAL